MEIFVVFAAYRQKEGEYIGVLSEAAFAKKEDAETYIRSKPIQWWETRQVPTNDGGTMPVEFLGIRSVHPTELKGL